MKRFRFQTIKNSWDSTPLLSILLGLGSVILFWRSVVDIERQWGRIIESLPVDTAGLGLTLSFYKVVVWPLTILMVFLAGFLWPRRSSK